MKITIEPFTQEDTPEAAALLAARGRELLHLPTPYLYLSVAGTLPGFRGRGIGIALTQHALSAARADGWHVCETDWRSTNLLSSRFWPRRGFRPYLYRLSRLIDPRIAWARGDGGWAAPETGL